MSKHKKLALSKAKGLIPELRFPEFGKDGEWKVKTIDDLCKVFRGKSFSKKDISKNGKYSCIHYGELFTKYNEVITDVYSKTNKSEGFKSEIGDVLMPSSDVTPDGLAKASTIMLDNVILGGDMNIIRPNINIDSIFLSYLLNHSKSEIIKLVSGTTVKHIYPSQIITCKIPITETKNEQKKIASCLSSLDEVIEARNQRLELLKNHKKGLMQNLFPQEGEKVPKYRFSEFENDGAWEIRSIEKNINLISGIALKSKEITDDKSGTPILRGINITEGQIRHSDEMDKFYLSDTSEIEKYLIKENDIVIGMDGSKVGKNVALISKEDEGAILIQRVARIQAINSDIEFLYQHFLSYRFRDYVDKVNTSSGIPHISAKQIRDFKINFPPTIEEQQKIASCLSALDELITAEAEKIEHLIQHKKGLMQGLFPKINN